VRGSLLHAIVKSYPGHHTRSVTFPLGVPLKGIWQNVGGCPAGTEAEAVRLASAWLPNPVGADTDANVVVSKYWIPSGRNPLKNPPEGG